MVNQREQGNASQDFFGQEQGIFTINHHRNKIKAKETSPVFVTGNLNYRNRNLPFRVFRFMKEILMEVNQPSTVRLLVYFLYWSSNTLMYFISHLYISYPIIRTYLFPQSKRPQLSFQIYCEKESEREKKNMGAMKRNLSPPSHPPPDFIERRQIMTKSIWSSAQLSISIRPELIKNDNTCLSTLRRLFTRVDKMDDFILWANINDAI